MYTMFSVSRMLREAAICYRPAQLPIQWIGSCAISFPKIKFQLLLIGTFNFQINFREWNQLRHHQKVDIM